MRLTDGMRSEIHYMNERIDALNKEAEHGSDMILVNIKRVRRIHFEELTAYKIRMEILFSETDVKEQSNILKIKIESFWYEIHHFFYYCDCFQE